MQSQLSSTTPAPHTPVSPLDLVATTLTRPPLASPIASAAAAPASVQTTAVHPHQQQQQQQQLSCASISAADSYIFARSYSEGDDDMPAVSQQQQLQQQQQPSPLGQVQLSALLQQQARAQANVQQADAAMAAMQQQPDPQMLQQQQQGMASLYAQLMGQPTAQTTTSALSNSPNPYALQQFLQMQAQMQMQAQLALMQQQQQQQQHQSSYEAQMQSPLQLANWFNVQQLQQLALLANVQQQQHQSPSSYPLSFGQTQMSVSPQVGSIAMSGGHSPYLSRHLQQHVVPQPHPTPLVAATFVGGPGSILHVDGLAPTVQGAPQVTADILFTLFGVYGDVMRIKLLPAAPALLDNSSSSPVPVHRSMPQSVVGSALLQFMNREQATLAMQNLDGIRVLGTTSAPMRVSVSQHGDIVESARQLAPQGDAHAGWSVRDYSGHAGHRFKYVSCKNSKHICAPCAALHVSGLSYQVGEQDLRDFFEGILHARATLTAAAVQRSGASDRDALLAGSVGSVHSVVLFGREKKMAFVVCSSLDAALAALVFGHNQKLKGKFIRITFSHAKEHQSVPHAASQHQQQHQQQLNMYAPFPQVYLPDAAFVNGQPQQQSQQPQPQQSQQYPTPHSHPPLRVHPSLRGGPQHDRSQSNDSDLSASSNSSQQSITSPSTHSLESVEQQLAAMGINISAHSSAHSSQLPSPTAASRAHN